jgi:predicted transcriptional regulator
MACVNPDGTLSSSAKELLKILNNPMTAEEISQKLNRPMFKVRSSLREMLEAKMISSAEDKYVITEEGNKKIQN